MTTVAKILTLLGVGVVGATAGAIGLNEINKAKSKEIEEIVNQVDLLIKDVKASERKYKAWQEMMDRQNKMLEITENNKKLMAKFRDEMRAKGYLPAEAEEIDPRDIDTTIDGDGIVSIA